MCLDFVGRFDHLTSRHPSLPGFQSSDTITTSIIYSELDYSNSLVVLCLTGLVQITRLGLQSACPILEVLEMVNILASCLYEGGLCV